MAHFKELLVWNKSMDLVEETYRLTRNLPKEELYGLTSQIRRSAVSVPSNIAEGAGRKARKDFSHFLKIAYGSLNELETQLILCCRLGYTTEAELSKAFQLTAEIGKMLNSIINKMSEDIPC